MVLLATVSGYEQTLSEVANRQVSVNRRIWVRLLKCGLQLVVMRF